MHRWLKSESLARAWPYVVVVAVGAVLNELSVPLAWLAGAVVAASGLGIAGKPVYIVPRSHVAAQLMIGITAGLSFTPEALVMTIRLGGPMLVAAGLSLVAGLLAAFALARMARVDIVSATLATLTVGPFEAAILARRHGLEPGPAIFAQCLRLLALVLLLPPILVYVDGSVGDPAAALRPKSWSLPGVLLVLGLGLVAAQCARACRIPNPWFMGPCLAAAVCSIAEVPVSPLPYALLALAQVMLGAWLGAAMDRRMLAASPRFLWTSSVAIVLLLAMSSLVGLLVAWLSGLSWQVGVLSAAPGGVGEMALTAQILQQGVSIVIGFHLVRIFGIQLFAPFIVRLVSLCAQGR